LLLPFWENGIHIRAICYFDWRCSTNIINSIGTSLTNRHILNSNRSLYSCTIKINLIYWTTYASLEWANMQTIGRRSIWAWTDISRVRYLSWTICCISHALTAYWIYNWSDCIILVICKNSIFLLSLPTIIITCSDT